MDSIRKSLYKSVSYRILMLISSFCVSKFLGMDNTKSIQLVIFLNSLNMMLFYIHERAWKKF